MIVFKYTKVDGAQYIAHLDVLRHIDRTLRRAGIPVAYSEGFHKHPRIFMSLPLGLGIKSISEYCTLDTPFEGDFKTLFNEYSPAGIKCVDFFYTPENINVAASITRSTYKIKGINEFDVDEVLSKDTFEIVDKKGNNINVRDRIFSLSFEEGALVATLASGTINLRPDVFGSVLCAVYGGKVGEIIKIESFGVGLKI